jgi:hypothetical protein
LENLYQVEPVLQAFQDWFLSIITNLQEGDHAIVMGNYALLLDGPHVLKYQKDQNLEQHSSVLSDPRPLSSILSI